MRRVMAWILLTAALLGAWTVLVMAAGRNGWFREALAPAGDTRAFFDSASALLDRENHGNASFVLIEDGRLFDQHAVSVGPSIDGNTLFQVASLSKWITAWGVMALVDQGRLDLDEPVSTYLTRWQLPKGDFDNAGVTVRRLLSHTSGLADGLGFAGFAPGTKLPTVEEALTKPNASPGHDGRIRVGYEPGTAFHYSGGGYLLLQLVVEEATGGPFATFMQQAVFQPLGMQRTTYLVDEGSSNVALSYTIGSIPDTLFQFTAVAAAGLYTTSNDVTRLLQAHLPGPNGEPAGRSVLKPATLALMRHPEASELGLPLWGLGTMLYAPTPDGSFVIGHDGSNEPAINTTARLDPSSGDGIVVLETGNRLLATRLAGEWVFWQTGKVDFLVLKMSSWELIRVLLSGWVAIILMSLTVGWRLRRGGRTAEGRRQTP